VPGDALWRTDAGVELHEGRTVEESIDGLETRIGELSDWREFPRPRC
jgi:hypothetical protein